MDTLIFNIDSRNRDLTKYNLDTEFEYNFNNSKNGKLKNVVEINVSSIELPNTSHFFNSTKGNTSFVIDSTTIQIDDGNYNSDDVVSAINDKIAETGILTIQFSVNNNTGNVIITVTDDHVFDFSNSTDYKSLGECLGFTDTIFNLLITTGTKVSTNIMNVLGEHYYFLKINDYGKVHHNNKKYFCKMIINAPKYEVVYETRNRYVTKEVEFRQPTNIQRLEITIEDTFGNIVVQNGIEISFTLELKVIRNDVLKRYKSLTFYSKDVMKIMLYDKMLDYFNKKSKNDSSGFKSTYHKLLKNSV